jgi:exodeoxyribonuclease-5
LTKESLNSSKKSIVSLPTIIKLSMIKNKSKFFHLLLDKFPHTATNSQERLLASICDFIFNKDKEGLFLLKGYAGTGKTTIMSTIVNNLWQVGLKFVLLAPTGRAAKVIANYSNKSAFTIHKKIYFPKKSKDGNVQFVLKQNKHTNTIFIIDEASMIPDSPLESKLFENGSLLHDLLYYVYSGTNCKAILIGDTAQLPPVKLDLSPALDENKLSFDFQKEVTTIELDEVMRQHKMSGILTNATNIRLVLSDYYNGIDFQFQINFTDVIRLVDGYDIENAINESYQNNGVEDTAIIVRSNKRANQYNQQIRLKIRNQENEISVGDFVMVVKNNYYWLDDNDDADFIANGDICEITNIRNYKNLYGFHFAEVTLRMIDYPNQSPFETVVMLDTLTSEKPSLPYEESNQLYQEIKKDFAHLKSKYRQLQEIKKSKYYNALQIKFSYAMTCHKSQGGQWKTVFIEQPYLPDGADVSYYRWLYTAVTRAQEKLYLIGFKDDFFIE